MIDKPSVALRDQLDKLHAFAATARAGSITAAAKELNLSQTAVSHSIKVLEDVFGVPLLTRTRSGVALTDSGRRLYDYSKRLLLEADSVEKAVRSPLDFHVGKLRVGTHETLAIHLWPDFLAGFARKFPGIQVSLISGRIDALVAGLLSHDFHLIVTVEPNLEPRLHREVLFRDRLSFFTCAKPEQARLPLLAKVRLTLEEAKTLPVLTDTQAHLEQRTPLPQLLLQSGFLESANYELNSFEAAIRLAEKGFGLALLPDRNAEAAVSAGRLRRVTVVGLPKDFGRYALCATSLEKEQADFLPALLRKELASAFGDSQ